MSLILFTTSQRLLSRVIRTFTWSDFSHVEVVHNGESIGAVMGKGVVRRTLSEVQAHSTEWLLFRAPGDGDAVWQHALSQVGKPYDYSGIFGLGFRRDWQDTDSWFCSELVAWAQLQAGAALVNARREVSRITPQDLLDSPLLLPV